MHSTPPFTRTTIISSMSEEYRLRSPSVGLDKWGDYDSDTVVTDLCTDFSQHDTQKVKALLDEVFPLAPNAGFKLLLVVAVVAHARVPCVGSLLPPSRRQLAARHAHCGSASSATSSATLPPTATFIRWSSLTHRFRKPGADSPLLPPPPLRTSSCRMM